MYSSCAAFFAPSRKISPLALISMGSIRVVTIALMVATDSVYDPEPSELPQSIQDQSTEEI